jgi:hypothetical protein
VTPAEAHKAILQTWIIQWPVKAGGTQSAPTVPYAIDNRKLANPSPPFAQVDIVNVNSDQATMGRVGARRFERIGYIDVHLFDARDQGRGATDTLAEYVREIFESTRIGAVGEKRGLMTLAMNGPTEIRNHPEFPDLWCVLCRVPFWYHQRR